jgi:predicted transcriptional regulator
VLEYLVLNLQGTINKDIRALILCTLNLNKSNLTKYMKELVTAGYLQYDNKALILNKEMFKDIPSSNISITIELNGH